MNTIFKKDLQLFFSDKKNVALTFLLPILLVSIFTLAFSGLRSDKKAANLKAIKIGLVDEDHSIASKIIYKSLDKEESLLVNKLDSVVAFNKLKQGKLVGVLYIKEGFMNSYLSKDQELNWTFNYLAGADFQMNIFKSFFSPMMEKIGRKYANVKNDCDMNTDMKLSFNAIGKEHIETSNDPWLIQPIIGIAIILLLFNTINIGGHFIDEYSDKTLNRLLISPTSYYSFIWSKFLIGVLINSIQLSLILVFANWFLGLKLFNIPILIVLILVCALVSASFLLLMTSLSKTRNQLNSLSIASILFLSAIGGSMMPTFIMPELMQKLSKFSINYWAIESFFDVLWRRVTFFNATYEKVLILLYISVSLLLISGIFFKRKRALL